MAFAGKVYGGRRMSGVTRSVLLVAGALILCGCAQKERRVAELHAPRAIWVTRWDYKTPQDIERIMDDVSGLGLDTVLFQVRGEGTVMYRSRLSTNLSVTTRSKRSCPSSRRPTRSR